MEQEPLKAPSLSRQVQEIWIHPINRQKRKARASQRTQAQFFYRYLDKDEEESEHNLWMDDFSGLPLFESVVQDREEGIFSTLETSCMLFKREEKAKAASFRKFERLPNEHPKIQKGRWLAFKLCNRLFQRRLREVIEDINRSIYEQIVFSLLHTPDSGNQIPTIVIDDALPSQHFIPYLEATKEVIFCHLKNCFCESDEVALRTVVSTILRHQKEPRSLSNTDARMEALFAATHGIPTVPIVILMERGVNVDVAHTVLRLLQTHLKHLDFKLILLERDDNKYNPLLHSPSIFLVADFHAFSSARYLKEIFTEILINNFPLQLGPELFHEYLAHFSSLSNTGDQFSTLEKAISLSFLKHFQTNPFSWLSLLYFRLTRKKDITLLQDIINHSNNSYYIHFLRRLGYSLDLDDKENISNRHLFFLFKSLYKQAVTRSHWYSLSFQCLFQIFSQKHVFSDFFWASGDELEAACTYLIFRIIPPSSSQLNMKQLLEKLGTSRLARHPKELSSLLQAFLAIFIRVETKYLSFTEYNTGTPSDGVAVAGVTPTLLIPWEEDYDDTAEIALMEEFMQQLRTFTEQTNSILAHLQWSPKELLMEHVKSLLSQIIGHFTSTPRPLSFFLFDNPRVISKPVYNPDITHTLLRALIEQKEYFDVPPKCDYLLEYCWLFRLFRDELFSQERNSTNTERMQKSLTLSHDKIIKAAKSENISLVKIKFALDDLLYCRLLAATKNELSLMFPSFYLHNFKTFEPLSPSLFPQPYANDIGRFSRDFPEWYSFLSDGRNLLLYGFGSKKRVLEYFVMSYIAPAHPCLIFNGFLATKGAALHIVGEISRRYFHAPPRIFSGFADHVEYLKTQFSRSQELFFIVIHNIDSSALSNSSTHYYLSVLASLPRVRMLASIDCPEALPLGLLFSENQLRYNWLHCEVTTMYSYDDEMKHASWKIQKTGRSQNADFLGDLVDYHHQVLKQLSHIQIEMLYTLKTLQGSASYIDFKSFKKKCQTSSSKTFLTNLNELREQNLVSFDEKRTPNRIGTNIELASLQQIRNCK